MIVSIVYICKNTIKIKLKKKNIKYSRTKYIK